MEKETESTEIIYPWDSRLWKGLLYGNPGTEKSFFAASMPKPMKLFQFDPFGKELAYLEQGIPGGIKRMDDGGMFQFVYADKEQKHLLIEIEYFADMIPHAVGTQKNLSAYERFQGALETHVNEGWAGFKSVVLDSYSFYELAVRRVHQYKFNPQSNSGNKQDARQWYAAARQAAENDIMSTLAWAPVHVCVIAHVDRQKVDLQDKQTWGIDAAGAMSGGVPRAFAETYYAYKVQDEKKGTYVQLLTDSDGMFIAHTHIGAPNPCAPRWEAVWRKS